MKSTKPTILSTLKSVILSIFVTAIALVAIILATIYLFPRSLVCGQHNVIEETYSPDGRYKAIGFLSSCGATTSFTVNVSIIRADAKLSPNQLGNVFRGPRGSTDIKIEWKSDSTLLISYPSYYVDIQTMKSEQLGIHVDYQEITP